MSDEAEDQHTQTLPLDAWHRVRGARMVPFAGYHMPIQYEGIIAEHLWTRSSAGLFDVSHMGQLLISGPDAAAALEALLPGDIKGLGEGKIRYSLLLNEGGGILDDLMVTSLGGGAYYMVVNGATKWDDIAHLREHLPDEIVLNHLEDQALLAVQGPKAVEAVARIWPQAANLYFMEGTGFDWNGVQIGISRSGYTGEDGVEISLPASEAERVATLLCEQPEIKPIGLGARDSLRLEAGLPLYGHDLDEATTPVMADLGFALSKRRREERNFPGAERILLEREQGAVVKRVGLFVEGRQPVREGATVVDDDGNDVGSVTSGGFSPSLERPIAMAYVPLSSADAGTRVRLNQRAKIFEGVVTPMPFVPHRYHRKGA
ncbi:glycine cleavage system aminomethyltransferase GcvT [Sphingomonas sp. ID1715]|uniref:glycine cleavage system aminomethyltransferase GcvT n=1 Tax=Sphingomonas sp. ID1715 TaxID=1656898 RepID=UPI001487C32B|nr:glycine cleavage system aminomethyltransferase GcvT [Sphingomonas sp. ID1715]NNM77516.1 glycine cleavage system aminomethyltransferase GcvT [Sphingomonas sp. ID1715]